MKYHNIVYQQSGGASNRKLPLQILIYNKEWNKYFIYFLEAYKANKIKLRGKDEGYSQEDLDGMFTVGRKKVYTYCEKCS